MTDAAACAALDYTLGATGVEERGRRSDIHDDARKRTGVALTG
jgi:hypothetical protein